MASARYHGHAPTICGYQNRDIDWVAGENVIGVPGCKHERGINRINGMTFPKQRACLAPHALVNRWHIDQSQETRSTRLSRPTPDLSDNNGAGAQGSALTVSFT
jgi:hypothetical protein